MTLDLLQKISDIEEIKTLKARYYRFNDTQDWNSFRTLLVDEATYDTGTSFLTSADQIVSKFRAGLAGGKTAHMAGLPEIAVTSPDEATGIWAFRDYIQLAGEGPRIGFFGYGHEHDEYVRTSEGWKFKSVIITRIRVDALEGGLPPQFE